MIGKLNFYKPFLVIVIQLIAINANCNNTLVKIDKIPIWVTETRPEINNNDTSYSAFGGYYYLLSDNQVNLTDDISYHHFSIKLLNNNGVQEMSDINVDFDPSYQILVFHEINLYRAGTKIDELRTHNIKTIQRETDMERCVYNGSLTAYVNLEDVREGDIIEYSYSKQGFNPIYNGNYFNYFYFEYNIPIKKIYTRLIVPNNKPLYFDYPVGTFKPNIQKKNSITEYTWEKNEANALIYDNNVPAWCNKNLRVEISSIANWNEIVKLSLKNYTVSNTDLQKLKCKAIELFNLQKNDSIVVSIIRFVQDKIRYLAFESGMSAYKPVQPCKVLDSRYGDCKAKSLLLCSLLKLIDIDAYPVLVNSSGLKENSPNLASLDIFNHCVVQINYQGKQYNIDPTITDQGGDISNIYFPDYGYGLVLKEDSKELVPLKNNVLSNTRIKNYFSIKKIGEHVNYLIITEYTGSCAENQRSYFQSNSMDEISKNYLTFYSKNYPSIRSLAPLKVKDDRSKNLFVVEEEYIIDSMWIPLKEKKQKLTLTTTALGISGIINVPPSPKRTMPYFVTFPQNCIEDIYLNLPEEWPVADDKTVIKDTVFQFLYHASYSNMQIHLQYDYKTFKDYIPAEAFESYYSKHEEISNNLSYQLTYNTALLKTFKFSWFIGALFLVLAALCTFLMIKIYRNFNLPLEEAIDNREIGGWLILIALGLFISTIKITSQFFFETNFFDNKTWYIITEHLTVKNIFLLILTMSEFIFNIFIIGYLILLQILFYKRRNILPRLIIIYFCVFVSFHIIDTAIAFTLMPDSYSSTEKNKAYIEIGQSLIVSLIWIPYFLYSFRVKETFTKVIETKNPGLIKTDQVNEILQ